MAKQNMNKLLQLFALLIGLVIVICFVLALTAGGHHGEETAETKTARHPLNVGWSFDGHLGTFDRVSAQRGLQVYREVCSNCHGLKRVAFRNLEAIGFSEDEVKAMAAEYSFPAIDSDGEIIERAGKPSDHFPSPFANEEAARASNGGALPPDLSLMVKARHDGANYIFSLITGFESAPAGFDLPEGKHYNPYFEGRKISMAPPLSTSQVEYADGTYASVDQMAKDVVNFLQWSAEPEMEDRKGMGLKVMLFLLVFTGFFIAAKKRIWKDVK